MIEYKLNDWGEFQGALDNIRRDYGVHLRKDLNDVDYPVENNIIFRGQANGTWPLSTTLERTASQDTFSISRYLEHAFACVHKVETFTRKAWELPPWSQQRELLSMYQKEDCWPLTLHCYDYLAYLRHHGFPSPLLDWTASPYIAAYFAFCDNIKSDNVAIYAFIEYRNGRKSCGTTRISSVGSYLTSHPRHFTQQAQYTFATTWDDHNREHVFCPHDNILSAGSKEQDVLIRITIPRSGRKQALNGLASYNINHYTLFNTEDALAKTMGIERFDLL